MRRPPVHPDAFDSLIETRTFTNGSDAAVVKSMYRDFFLSVAPNLAFLVLDIFPSQVNSTADWGCGPDDVVAQLAKALREFTALQVVFLYGHSFSVEHMERHLIPAICALPEINDVLLSPATVERCSHLFATGLVNASGKAVNVEAGELGI